LGALGGRIRRPHQLGRSWVRSLNGRKLCPFLCPPHA
jgi:hypothetical protein